jgi:hypothetical protein
VLFTLASWKLPRTPTSKYEGCLSFFDVRGTVQRPLRSDVEHTDLDGITHITHFDHAAARPPGPTRSTTSKASSTPTAPPGVDPVLVERYHGTGTSWRYDPSTD